MLHAKDSSFINEAMADGNGALYNAVRYKNPGAVEALVEAGAELTSGFSALMYYPSAHLGEYLKTARQATATAADQGPNTAIDQAPATAAERAAATAADRAALIDADARTAASLRGTSLVMPSSLTRELTLPLACRPANLRHKCASEPPISKRFKTTRVHRMLDDMDNIPLSEEEEEVKAHLQRLLDPTSGTAKLLLVGDSIAEELVTRHGFLPSEPLVR